MQRVKSNSFFGCRCPRGYAYLPETNGRQIDLGVALMNVLMRIVVQRFPLGPWRPFARPPWVLTFHDTRSLCFKQA